MNEPQVEVELPYNWRPRVYQQPLWNYLEDGGKRACCVWHRRGGKDITCLNFLATRSMQRVGSYWHVLPTYAQGRKNVWENFDKTGRAFLDYFPPELIIRKRDDEMKIWLRHPTNQDKQGSTVQIIGADKPDLLVGPNPIGVILSEYSVQNPAFWDFVRPILAENGGWAVFIFTPRGRNHGYRLLERSKKNPNWFWQVLTVDDTHAIPLEAIEDDRQSGMSEEMIRQEYYCDFNIALIGSYYGSHMAAARNEGRIGLVPWEPSIPVDTGWDLGSANSTCIWFKQQVGAQRRVIDFYKNSGKDLAHYAKILHEKPYVYGKNYLPHDVEVKEMNAKQNRKEILRSLGIKVTVVPRSAKIDDDIEVVKNYLRTCWFDEEKTGDQGIPGLLEYVKKESGELGKDGEVFYSDEPLHNWASDVADAFRTLAMGDRQGKYARTPDPERRNRPSQWGRRVAIV
jgi:phage terminase large subunit